MKFANFPIPHPCLYSTNLHRCSLVINPDLLNIPFVPNLGTLVSEPGYEPPLEATLSTGATFCAATRTAKRVRLDVSSRREDSTSGAMLRFSYNGVVGVAGDEGRVIRGDNATTTGFGNAFVQVRFETNASGLKPLQDKLYVGSGRFIVEENQPIIVEYKISEVGAQCSEQPEGG
ncbi:hypothetical protein NCS56_01476800 [Fusarium sp. Ph1]|nr:hypothetical protein NCS56_01476800 [Fusarium sp. Ph1]